MSTSSKLRWSAVGDAQTSFGHFLRVLRRGGVVDGEKLSDGEGLLCVGDYFDYGVVDDSNAAQVGSEGTHILRWVTSYPADRTIVLLGNHDLARVMELAFESDTSFRAAQHLAREVASGLVPRDEFLKSYPYIPTPEVALRDFSTFCVEQRKLVQDLLMAGRVRLAAVAHIGGRPALVTHAAVTTHDLANLGIAPTTDVSAIAAAMNDFLDEAVRRVAPLWRRGEDAALDLGPVCIPGYAGVEGGGLVLHRPADPNRAEIADPAWEGNMERIRRYDPGTLVPGIQQICGHTSHARCCREMPRWTDEATAHTPPGRVRVLTVHDDGVRYRVGNTSSDPTALFLIDGDMNRVTAEAYETLPLEGAYVP